MPATVCGDPSETFERYALGLARRDGLRAEAGSGAWRRQMLLVELARLGVHGWPSRRTLTTTGRLPEGCKPCLEGRGSNLCLTTHCNRDCFFCFNPKPRAEGMSVHGRPARDAAHAAELLAEVRVASVGLSGGEPLLRPELALQVARALKARFGTALHIDLYTNGDRLTPELLRAMRQAGVDGLRINLAARGYDPEPVRLALRERMPAEVELPVIPAHEERLQRLMEELDAMGARHLILHELFVSGQNVDSLQRQGLTAKEQPGDPLLPWSPVSESEEAAYRLMIHALKRGLGLSVYYCSCGTQEWIAERALARAGKPSESGSTSS
ncbi:MAG: radical SAM protein [Elusimicrobia bacterium]|nr:radical SAM protein [Elusimicrobiota bacterium]